jgi:hypothetical protein
MGMERIPGTHIECSHVDIDFEKIVADGLATEMPKRLAELERALDDRDVTGVVEDPDGELELALSFLRYSEVELSGGHDIKPHLQRFCFASRVEFPKPISSLHGVFVSKAVGRRRPALALSRR